MDSPDSKTNADEKAPVAHFRDPLHGVRLEQILNELVQRHGWSEMGRRIPVRCFQHNPSVKSSLTFLRKTPWARAKIEDWFLMERVRK
jgi:uncharacterized protein (DUF2132 family)